MEHTASTVNGCLEAALLKYVSKEVFCDVTLVSDDFQLFPAHKLVLAAHSPVLERLLLSLGRTNDNTVLHMRGYKGVSIQRMLNFLYSGEAVEDNDSNMNNLVMDLKIAGLMKDVPVTNIPLSCLKKSQQNIDGIISNHKILKHKSISLNVITENKEEEIRMETRGVQKEGVNPSGMEGVLDLSNHISDNYATSKLIITSNPFLAPTRSSGSSSVRPCVRPCVRDFYEFFTQSSLNLRAVLEQS